MKGLFFMFFFAVAVAAVGMMVLGTGSEPVAAGRAPVLSEMEQRIEGAHSRGATLFQYNRDDTEGTALCNGKTRLMSLDTNTKEFRLTSQEAANLSLCRRDPNTGNYYAVQAIPDTMPGDFLMWDEGGLHDTKYTPQ